MDPLSVTASIIAVGTVAGKICSAFTELRSLCRSLPGRLHALNNEVADLEISSSSLRSQKDGQRYSTVTGCLFNIW
ncbi:hypothetical protein GTR04_0360 [Trichophyton interdigitale]|uniref:Fungal N-terminal domain-containing protein n=1 Tax=Trichophyton interdigitale TaxID=101480 RepID=A0A9P5CWU2_9EURO|nr:hypothetical protein GY631_1806 [Trichophyton interdigitale]KAF3898551.1 hypothetical protein GY632_1744 [Trichophyton interdigitale]KAG8212257.1 hypothetical protein GTR04_0360 [Trichophyton interdigitale]